MIKENLVEALSRKTFGRSITASMRVGYGNIPLRKYLKCRTRIKHIRRAIEKNRTYLDQCEHFDSAKIHPVRAPLVLISQIQRSGGSFLSQLFDGHPEIHAHPHELTIGYPFKQYWPQIDLTDRPENWFFLLFEDIVLEHIKSGYRKDMKERNGNEAHSFLFAPALQKEIFLRYVKRLNTLRLRDVFDAYMTSYFNAWLNNRNISGDSKKYITAFTPRLAMWEENMAQFAEIYPDGKLVAIVRDPKNWFPSASRHKPKYKDLQTSMRLWVQSVRATIANKENFGERVCVIKFEDLVQKTEPVMRFLAEFLAISFHPILLTPTFNRSPIQANTSFTVEDKPIINTTLYRYKTLRQQEVNLITSLTDDVYKMALTKVVAF